MASFKDRAAVRCCPWLANCRTSKLFIVIFKSSRCGPIVVVLSLKSFARADFNADNMSLLFIVSISIFISSISFVNCL